MVEQIYQLAASLLHAAIAGFNSGGSVDEEIAIQTRDKEVDAAHKKLAKKLTKQMEANPEHIKDYFNLQFILILFLARSR